MDIGGVIFTGIFWCKREGKEEEELGLILRLWNVVFLGVIWRSEWNFSN